MERRNYLKISSRISFMETSSSSVHEHFQKKHSKFHGQEVSRHSNYQVQSSQYSKIHLLNHSKHNHTTRMSMKPPSKRSHKDDDNMRPFKKFIVEVTGFDKDPVLDDLTIRTTSIITTSEVDLYQRRRRVAKSVDVVRKRKDMVSKVAKDWTDMPAIAQKGLSNFTGAICYRLSLLQVLLHQTLFVHWILEYHRPQNCVSDSTNCCVTCVLRLLILEYWRGSQDPSGTLRVLQRMNNLFKELGWASDVRSGHADPEEHITWLFKILASELPSSIFDCLEAIMQPVLCTIMRCSQCGHESRTNGHQDRTLPVPLQPAFRNGTLDQYLQRYMIEKLNDYRCDGCGDKPSPKQRKQLFNYAPEILSVQLKTTDAYGDKLNIHVTIDPLLDLNPYRDNGMEDQLLYELTAVIKHSGNDSRSGHYIALARGPNGAWSQFNDSRKTTSTLATAVSSKGGFTPYILFYHRKE